MHAFTTVAINRALYTTQHSSLTLAELRQLDVPVNNFNRKITENMCSFPNAVLTGPVEVAGIGCPIISTQTNMRKKSVAHRNVHRKGPHSQAAISIIQRAYRDSMIPIDEFQDTPPSEP